MVIRYRERVPSYRPKNFIAISWGVRGLAQVQRCGVGPGHASLLTVALLVSGCGAGLMHSRKFRASTSGLIAISGVKKAASCWVVPDPQPPPCRGQSLGASSTARV